MCLPVRFQFDIYVVIDNHVHGLIGYHIVRSEARDSVAMYTRYISFILLHTLNYASVTQLQSYILEWKEDED